MAAAAERERHEEEERFTRGRVIEILRATFASVMSIMSFIAEEDQAEAET